MNQSLILRRNKAFAKKSKLERKIAVLKDMLKILKSSNYTFEDHNVYAMVESFSGFSSDLLKALSPIEFQEELIKDQIPCNVCVRGAAVLARIRVGNGDRNIHELKDDGIDGFNNDGRNILSKEFTIEELEVMESIFEGRIMAYHYPDDAHDRAKMIVKICLAYPTQIISALMKNGKFSTLKTQ